MFFTSLSDLKSAYFFEINFHPDVFEKHLPEGKNFDIFKKMIHNKEIGRLSEYNYPITPEMLTIIDQITKCTWKNKFRQMFLEAKVTELLMLQLSQMTEGNLAFTSSETPKGIIDKMYYARDLVIKELNNPMQLKDLAKAVNTNECTLKKEFKNIFGTTVFGYIRDTQMKRAKELLTNHGMPVGRVSEIIGYKNPQHFTTAFKRKYGISPSKIGK